VSDATTAFVDATWDDIVPVLCDYVRVPSLSPAFDPAWEANGHLQRAVDLLEQWARHAAVEGATVEVMRLPGLTPVILVDVPATPGDDTGEVVLLYGHLDKQPEMVGWRKGLGPWEPVVEDGRLFGRGAGDDGYALFAALTAINAVREAGGRHRRCLVLIEASEESGSPHLPAYLDALGERLAPVDLVVCLDAGCADYERLWVTTSLRGLLSITLRVSILEEGVHSGASGVVPSTFRITRALLSRLEDDATGRMLLPELVVEVPDERRRQAAAAAEVVGEDVWARYPFVAGARPAVDDPVEAVLARTWSPALEVTGADGIPPTAMAGNVLRPFTQLHLSVRLPPTCPVDAAYAAVERALTGEPPHGAKVDVHRGPDGPGWNAPPTADWLSAATAEASRRFWGEPAAATGEGGTIPFLSMLGERLPDAQFLVTGVMGPGSNAHGPNEFLDLPTARRVTSTVACVLDAHARR
jgi:acetylornithine deacetylase/succinyl-diaminopimelate desuccinylase-like protein